MEERGGIKLENSIALSAYCSIFSGIQTRGQGLYRGATCSWFKEGERGSLS
jgi:hypothetical protein